MTLPTVLTLSFWFQPFPPPLIPSSEIVLGIVLVVLLFAGILAFVIRRRFVGDHKLHRRAWAKAGTALLTSGLVGLMLYGFNYERVPYLSMRILFLIWMFWIVWQSWKIYEFVTVYIPEVERGREEQERLNKWLPKNKKKK